MKHFTLIFSILVLSQYSIAQFPIGSQTITYNDPDRTGGFGSGGGPGRQIECAVYYPATSAGANTPVAAGQFPIVVFGHGFAIEWSAYQNIWQHFVPQGFIMIFPKTEGSLFPAPSHNDFGLDLALVSERLLAENSEPSSPFYQKINGNSAIMGHSMGGGATVLAAQNNSNIKTIIGLAPAETNPSAVTAAGNVTVPALVLSGSSDGVTPPSEHHIPIYEDLGSPCKSFVNMLGGAHCYFANANVFCDFGEGSASTGITLTRAQQQAQMNSMISPWLNYYLKGECLGYSQFYNAASSQGLVLTQNCSSSPLLVAISITNATNNQNNGSASVTVTGGQEPYTLSWNTGSAQLTNVAAGNYTLTYTDASCTGTITVTIGNQNSGANIDNESNSNLELFPNPTKDQIQIISQMQGLYDIKIIDASGRIVYLETAVNLELHYVSVSHLEIGVYSIQFSNELGTFSKRIIRE
jgi:dienelactone hydrolase